MNAPGVAGSLVVALLLLLPEEVLFRGYAFQRLVDCPIDLYSIHAIRREGSAYAQRMGLAVLL